MYQIHAAVRKVCTIQAVPNSIHSERKPVHINCQNITKISKEIQIIYTTYLDIFRL